LRGDRTSDDLQSGAPGGRRCGPGCVAKEERMRPIVLALLAAGCGNGAQMSVDSAALHDHGDNPNSMLFEKDALAYGASMTTWGERASQWMWGTPADHNPL